MTALKGYHFISNWDGFWRVSKCENLLVLLRWLRPSHPSLMRKAATRLSPDTRTLEMIDLRRSALQKLLAKERENITSVTPSGIKKSNSQSKLGACGGIKFRGAAVRIGRPFLFESGHLLFAQSGKFLRISRRAKAAPSIIGLGMLMKAG